MSNEEQDEITIDNVVSPDPNVDNNVSSLNTQDENQFKDTTDIEKNLENNFIEPITNLNNQEVIKKKVQIPQEKLPGKRLNVSGFLITFIIVISILGNGALGYLYYIKDVAHKDQQKLIDITTAENAKYQKENARINADLKTANETIATAEAEAEEKAKAEEENPTVKTTSKQAVTTIYKETVVTPPPPPSN